MTDRPAPADGSACKPPGKPSLGLSGKLLILTIAFVMLSEILIYAPSAGRFRLEYLQDRLAITYPEILEMQVHAIIEAACICKKAGVKVLPEIMIPLAGTKAELDFCKKHTVAVAEEVMKEQKVKVDYLYGTMIEVPRAAVSAKWNVRG